MKKNKEKQESCEVCGGTGVYYIHDEVQKQVICECNVEAKFFEQVTKQDIEMRMGIFADTDLRNIPIQQIKG